MNINDVKKESTENGPLKFSVTSSAWICPGRQLKSRYRQPTEMLGQFTGNENWQVNPILLITFIIITSALDYSHVV